MAAIGTDGSVYFLPSFNDTPSPGMPVTSGALQSSCEGSPCQNGYVARLSPLLDSLIFGTYLPGIAQATAQLGSDGSVYYAGTALAGFPTTPSAYQPQNAGGYDGIVARLDPTGSTLLFATYYGTAGTDWILNIAVAPDLSVWASVWSFAECCPVNASGVIHLDANGEKLLAQSPLAINEMVVDHAGDLIALAAAGFTITPDALAGATCNANVQAYSELNPSGQELFATYLPGGVQIFDGADIQGTPILDAPIGRVEVMIQEQATGPFAGCLVDSAAFTNAPPVTSPGAIVTIFGSGLGPGQGVTYQLENGQVPTTLGGTQVLVNGEPAPILYASAGQLNLVMPYSLAAGSTATVQVVNNGTASNTLSEPIVAQGISVYCAGITAAALNQDYSVNSAQNPAQPGSVVMLFGTGGGQTSPASIAGDITPLSLFPLVAPPQAMVDLMPANVVWAGGAPGLVSGVTQVNVELPEMYPGFHSGTQAVSVAVLNSNGMGFDANAPAIWVAIP